MNGRREACRDARGWRPLEILLGDARFALRHFRRTWGSAAAMVLVLALGIGANTALYSALQAFLTLFAPGIPRDERLVRIRGEQRRPGREAISRRLSYSEVLTYAAHGRVTRLLSLMMLRNHSLRHVELVLNWP